MSRILVLGVLLTAAMASAPWALACSAQSVGMECAAARCPVMRPQATELAATARNAASRGAPQLRPVSPAPARPILLARTDRDRRLRGPAFLTIPPPSLCQRFLRSVRLTV